jgi:anti-sigma regulatory factor (Ser/Thr protein kinase)
MPHAEVTLPGATSSVPTARRFVESSLASWGMADLGWSAAMCISELAGNCALHARTEFRVRVQLEDDVVRLEVSDGSPRVPAQRAYGTDATTGRGLRLIEEYASSWGVEMTATGKTVWVVLKAPTPHLIGPDDDGDAALESLRAAFGGDGEDGGDARASGTWQVAA